MKLKMIKVSLNLQILYLLIIGNETVILYIQNTEALFPFFTYNSDLTLPILTGFLVYLKKKEMGE